jgi:hypothetical protein
MGRMTEQQMVRLNEQRMEKLMELQIMLLKDCMK